MRASMGTPKMRSHCNPWSPIKPWHLTRHLHPL